MIWKVLSGFHKQSFLQKLKVLGFQLNGVPNGKGGAIIVGSGISKLLRQLAKNNLPGQP